jgi:hypothetical protein
VYVRIAYDNWASAAKSVTATGILAGDHVIRTTANTTDLQIFVDDMVTAKNTVSLAGSSVPGNGNSWFLMSNAMSYMDYYYHSVNGTTVVQYEPVDIIHYAGIQGILPDRTTPAEDGLITFGANPVAITGGVYTTLGGFVSSSQPAPGAIATAPTRDIIPVGGGVDLGLDQGISTKLQTNPLRPLIQMVSDNTTFTERQVWTWSGVALILLVLMLVATRVRGHQLVTGVAVAVTILALIVLTIFPLWTLIFVVVAVIAGIISERAPSL